MTHTTNSIELNCTARMSTEVWDWQTACPAGRREFSLDCVRPESSTHRPRTRVRVAVDSLGLHVGFHVEDQYMIVRRRALHGAVCCDSCVEMFIRPPGSGSYINFEFNALKDLHASYISDWQRTAEGFVDFRFLKPEELSGLQVDGGVTTPIDPEDPAPRTWVLQFFVPWQLFREVAGVTDVNGIWHANFYKCADDSSHSHWLSWNRLQALNFHAPDDFGRLEIAGVPASGE